ncbi:unnamed protein product [Fraxinus pennsylvanica]|uniref:DUF3700 domain-containing protein n=1 Tax=Fraxinus pennsylvanica TaxID=56036 RepID=A0AAD1ZX61_9LAMI|nr:unnamed protein product [Fraxinus pennsylvanica]
MGSLNNLCALIKKYGLARTANEAMLVIEAYRTLRDRCPYPANQVIKDLDGSFAFVVYDSKVGTVFTALGSNGGVKLYWGIAADGSVVISNDIEVIKASCAKSFAPFPTGCIFHSEGGLMSFEHPMNKLRAMPRVDSEGVMCGAISKLIITLGLIAFLELEVKPIGQNGIFMNPTPSVSCFPLCFVILEYLIFPCFLAKK